MNLLSHLKEQLDLLSLTNKVIIVPDPDKAGLNLLKYSKYNLVPDKLIDEMTELQFSQLVKQLGELL